MIEFFHMNSGHIVRALAREKEKVTVLAPSHPVRSVAALFLFFFMSVLFSARHFEGLAHQGSSSSRAAPRESMWRQVSNMCNLDGIK